MARYEVRVVYRGLSNFIVEAATPEEAKEKAREMFNNGEEAPVLGNEWEEIDTVHMPIQI
jgi:hypothetical protein